MIAQYAPFAMAAILVLAMGFEMKTGRIPNWLTTIPILLFMVVFVAAENRSALYWQIGVAAAVFVVGLLFFAFAGLGAGAVKLMTGLALFVPLENGWGILAVYVGTLFVTAFVVIQLRKAVGSEQSSWHVMAKNILPMSVPIGLTGLAALFLL